MNGSQDLQANPQRDRQANHRDLEPISAMATIGDMARLYGLTLRALRFYEDRGLIAPLRHGTSRFYDAETRARIDVIRRGKQLGFTLTQISDLLSRDKGSEKPTLGFRSGEVEAQIERLERKRRDIELAIDELRVTHRRMAIPASMPPMNHAPSPAEATSAA